jgi:hypothetical protein
MYDLVDCKTIRQTFVILCISGHLVRINRPGMASPGWALSDYRLGTSIRNTSCGAELPIVISNLIMTFIDWEDTVKFGYLSDAVRREEQVA